MNRAFCTLLVCVGVACGGDKDQAEPAAANAPAPTAPAAGDDQPAPTRAAAPKGGCAQYADAVRAAGFTDARQRGDDRKGRSCTFEIGSEGDSMTIQIGMRPFYDAAKDPPRAVEGIGARAERIDSSWLFAWRDDGALVGLQWSTLSTPFPEEEAAALARALLPGLQAPPPRPTYTDADFASKGYCGIKVTGDITEEARVPGAGSTSITTKHWQGEDSGGPRFMLNCGDSSGEPFFFNFVLARDTTAAQFPMKPATYELASGKAKAGQVAHMMSQYQHVPIHVEGAARFEITRFDEAGIAGGFTIPATVKPRGIPRKVVIEGSFELPCAGRLCKR